MCNEVFFTSPLHFRALEIVGPGRISAEFQAGSTVCISVVNVSFDINGIDVFFGKIPNLMKVNIWDCDPRIKTLVKTQRPHIEITECATSILSSVVDFQQK